MPVSFIYSKINIKCKWNYSLSDVSMNGLESIEPFIRLAPQISELTLDSNKISSIGKFISFWCNQKIMCIDT